MRAPRWDEVSLVAAAKGGDGDAFATLVERYRRELHVHCYRMLGSLSEAEDLTQETYLKAWRALGRFEGRSSVRTWLYRIATNACLDVLARRPSRLLPYDVAPPTPPGGTPADAEYLSIEPYPDDLLGWSDDADRPDVEAVANETIELAFLAAIQHLPPRQRAVVILRDVLGWSAKETAAVLEMSEAAVKSALQRARPMLAQRLPRERDAWRRGTATEDEVRVLHRYIAAMEGDDLNELAMLLRDDAVVSYPPQPLWRDTRDSFIAASSADAPPGDYRFLPTRANGQPAVAIYHRASGAARFVPVALEVLRIEAGAIAEIVDFDLPALIPAFGLPASL